MGFPPRPRSCDGVSRRVRRARWWCGLVVVLAAMVQAAMAQNQGPAPGGRIVFDIPAQPLDEALLAYSIATRIDVVAHASLLAGRRSTAVTGSKTAAEALQVLLTGTGLAARSVDRGSFTLAVQPPAATPDAPSDVPRYPNYSALLQNVVKRALCRQPDTHPGAYRSAIQLWIAPSGAVERAVIVGTTGDAARDRGLAEAFRGLSIGVPPPAGLPQPATLLILPRTQASDCAAAPEARGR